MAEVSRLWKRLGLTAPLFNVWTESDSAFQMSDHDITAITINRGSADGIFGEQDHTLEVNSIVMREVRTGAPIHCDLTASGAQKLVDLVGGTTDSIRRRYFGRIGRQTVDDGGGIFDTSRWHTTFVASKWQSQLKKSDRVRYQLHGTPLRDFARNFMRPARADLPHLPDPEYPSPESHYGYLYNDYDLEEQALTYSEFVTKYLEEPGYYVQNMRDGRDRLLTIERRWSEANSRLLTDVPITRSQVLAPAQWEQPNEDAPSNHSVRYRNAAGVNEGRVVGPDPSDDRVPVIDHDVSHIRWLDNYQPTQMNYARHAAERIDTGYRLPTMEINLLRLIASTSAGDRLQAQQLLRLEMGDPIFLSYDWYPYLRGVLFVSGITEKITPDGWELSLSLVPSLVVVAHRPPDVPPQAWDSARYSWDNETRRWDEP